MDVFFEGVIRIVLLRRKLIIGLSLSFMHAFVIKEKSKVKNQNRGFDERTKKSPFTRTL
jgi:hypothetical protein